MPSLPKELSDVVAKMLAKKPGERYQTPAEVISALTPFMVNSAPHHYWSFSYESSSKTMHFRPHFPGFHQSHSSQRLPTVPANTGSNIFPPLESDRETGTVASLQTTRGYSRTKSVMSKPGAHVSSCFSQS